MIGVRTSLILDITNIASEEIINEQDILTIKENVGNLPKSIAELINAEYCTGELDSVGVEIQAIQYLDYDDLEEIL